MRNRTRLAGKTALPALLLLLACGPARAQPESPKSWRLRSGPEGGSVSALLASGNDVYAGMAESGVFRSAGGSGSWTPVHDGLGSRSVRALAGLPDRILAATDSGLFTLAAGGDKWQAAPGAPRKTLYSLFAQGALILAGTDEGVLRSPDGGATWKEIKSEWPYVFALARLGGFLYAGSENGAGISRSDDEGLTWTAVNSGLPLDAGISVYALQGHAGAMFAGTSAGLYRSPDSGATWAKVTQGIPDDAQFASFAAENGDLFAGTFRDGAFRSGDGGATWTPLPGLSEGSGVHAILARSGSIWAGNRLDGVFRLPAGDEAWSEANAGLTGIAPQSLACGGDFLAAAWNDRVFLSRDRGATWGTLHVFEEEPEQASVALWRGSVYLGTREGFWEGDLEKTPVALKARPQEGAYPLVRMDSSLLLGTSAGTLRWEPGEPEPVPFPADFAILAAGPGWLRGYDRYGHFDEYTAAKGAWTRYDAPDLEVQSMAELDAAVVVATESLEAYVLHAAGAGYAADRLALPFPVGAFCRDGDRIYAGTAGDGVAEYLGKDAPNGIRNRRSAHARPVHRSANGSLRASPVFSGPGRAGGREFDASGRSAPISGSAAPRKF